MPGPEDDAEVGHCGLCNQQMIKTKNDCWHPREAMVVACPPEPPGLTPEWGAWYAAGNRTGRPGREHFREGPGPGTEAEQTQRAAALDALDEIKVRLDELTPQEKQHVDPHPFEFRAAPSADTPRRIIDGDDVPGQEAQKVYGRAARAIAELEREEQTDEQRQAHESLAADAALAAAQSVIRTPEPTLSGELARTVADTAVGLFLEFRDDHGYSEQEARQEALDLVEFGADAIANGGSVRILIDEPRDPAELVPTDAQIRDEEDQVRG